jgi:hypothetical protein
MEVFDIFYLGWAFSKIVQNVYVFGKERLRGYANHIGG